MRPSGRSGTWSAQFPETICPETFHAPRAIGFDGLNCGSLSSGKLSCISPRTWPASRRCPRCNPESRRRLIELRFRVAKFGRFGDASRGMALGKNRAPRVCRAVRKERSPAHRRPAAENPALCRPLSASFSRSFLAPGRWLSRAVLERFVHDLRIGLAARSAHDLPDKKLEHTFIAGAIFRDIVRILLHDFAAQALDFAAVLNLRQPFRGDDFLAPICRSQTWSRRLFCRWRR